jgi:hypothetical protein
MSCNEIIKFWPPISAFTRTQAIEDSVLIAVDESISSETGFTFPIVMMSLPTAVPIAPAAPW